MQMEKSIRIAYIIEMIMFILLGCLILLIEDMAKILGNIIAEAQFIESKATVSDYIVGYSFAKISLIAFVCMFFTVALRLFIKIFIKKLDKAAIHIILILASTALYIYFTNPYFEVEEVVNEFSSDAGFLFGWIEDALSFLIVYTFPRLWTLLFGVPLYMILAGGERELKSTMIGLIVGIVLILVMTAIMIYFAYAGILILLIIGFIIYDLFSAGQTAVVVIYFY